MKKKTHQLKIDRETLRQLSPTKLTAVVGGTNVSQGTACRTWCTPCGSGGTTTGTLLQ